MNFANGNFQRYKTLLEQKQKIDVYPKSFFQGEWYYAITPVTASSKGFLGGGDEQHWLSLDNEGWFAPVVHFEFREKYLMAYNTNREKSGRSENETHSVSRDRWVFKIPLENLDYYSVESNNIQNAGLSETIDTTDSDHSKPWAGLNFNNVEMVIQKFQPKHFNSDTGYFLKELIFSSDYFSFEIKDIGSSRTFRFSLLKKTTDKSSYIPIYLTDDMLNTFPPFVAYRRITPTNKNLRGPGLS